VKVLHTADWHVGKKLGRIDRLDETRAVLDELVAIAEAEQPDLILVAGDLFDRALPPFASMGLVLTTLVRLAGSGAPVVAVAGNHDSADLFAVLAPYLTAYNITLVHKPLRPEDGGVVGVTARDGTTTAQIACFPFLHETQIVEFMDASEEWFKSYAERIRKISSHYANYMAASDPSALNFLVGHFMIDGATPSGSERKLHIGDAYMTTPAAVPAEINYTALGHIHACQKAPSGSGEAWYAGSLMQLDFGEAQQDKFCLLVDVTRDRTRIDKQIPITSARALRKVSGTLEELSSRADEFGDDYLDVSVRTEGPSPGLADAVREVLPHALNVRADYERAEAEALQREGMGLDELYAGFVREARGAEPTAELMAAFNELRAEVGADW
jgi:exonuclease SbcD